jgi:hypothetical protein
MRGVSRIATAHDGIADRRERLRQPAVNNASFRCGRQRDEHQNTGEKESQHDSKAELYLI